MMIYEVNLSIPKDIYTTYMQWLKPHIQKMLSFPGFQNVRMLKPCDTTDTGYISLTLWYEIESAAYLNHYLQEHASAMRQEAAPFAQTCHITRRILEQLDQI
ncbi:MAG TPA: DUF4286 family protein [Legionellaceae bacterium]|nr:DUF4286 family protein [Legionellaceae bacterium]